MQPPMLLQITFLRMQLSLGHPLVHMLDIRGCRPQRLPSVLTLHAPGLPSVLLFSGGHLFRDIGRAFYMRTGLPIHNIKPEEIEREVNVVVP